jgi:hypothetical protein
MMTNLLDETELAIWDSGHTPGDIVFIGSVETAHACTWEQFRRLANFEYETHGVAQIPTDLRIVFRDGSDLHREDVDGLEWWEFCQPFICPKETKPIVTLHLDERVQWPKLAEIQPDDGECGSLWQ